MSNDLCFLSATELRARIGGKELSPVEITRAVLARAEALQPELNCFITLCGDEAMAQAREAERKVMAGEPLGLLHGLPVTVKDIVNTRGVKTTFGAVPYKDNVPKEDAVAVARLRAQGAILIGKTTTPEFGSKCLTDSPLFGRTRNAWDAGRSSGGSSGGAAVAVASGIAPLAIATDGGGSTRIPAACNGVVGIKQSNGVIPHSQVQDAFGNQTYVTPTTRTVADTALMMQAMAGEDASDPWSIGVPVSDFIGTAAPRGDLRGQRILFCLSPPGRPVSADVAASFKASLDRLAGLGAELEEFSGEGFDIEPIWRAINHTVWRTRFSKLVAEHGDVLSDTFVKQVALATNVSGVDYQEAMFARTALFRRVQSLLARGHLLAMPTVTRTALPIDQDLFGTIEIDGQQFDSVRPHWFPWTMLFNMTGHPAVSLPCGFGHDGLPIGLQLVGRFRADAELLRVSALFEASHDLLSRWPE
ncbi:MULTISPECIES: amidase family protein [unclassified Bradyrhizobium]|uniref:amidase n=1 Tax=unclassified Bradyrhizobium TaxID=2631580 RepID=UPI002479FF92|nr:MULTISPECIES: amidase family protein [unclassified Bradyrhizobium]WGR68842.1 amidase family protein [Bradyrhizobium sp. ISRA426]WGR80897.1 amidase family protein [Bradyrhizobium sp. ISRA430]WGR84082.1 amidase family protein [Bradyrhizobium sp. ISRA432]